MTVKSTIKNSPPNQIQFRQNKIMYYTKEQEKWVPRSSRITARTTSLEKSKLKLWTNN